MGQYTPIFQFWKKELIGIPYGLVKWRDIRVKVEKMLFILAIMNKSLHIVLDALMKKDGSQSY